MGGWQGCGQGGSQDIARTVGNVVGGKDVGRVDLRTLQGR